MAKNKQTQTSFDLGLFDLFSESLNEPQKQNMEPTESSKMKTSNKHPGGGYQPKNGLSKPPAPPTSGSNAVVPIKAKVATTGKVNKNKTSIPASAIIASKDALELARENYKEYSKYIAAGRAYPCIIDGAKSSYKRAIYGMWKRLFFCVPMVINSILNKWTGFLKKWVLRITSAPLAALL